MPEITVTADKLYEMAVTRMRQLETRMDEVVGELNKLREEHGKLYTMATAYDDDNEAVQRLGDDDNLTEPQVVRGAANITITKGEF